MDVPGRRRGVGVFRVAGKEEESRARIEGRRIFPLATDATRLAPTKGTVFH